MAEIQLATGHIFSLNGVTLGSVGTNAIASYISPNLQNASFEHGAESIRIKGQNGAIKGLIFIDDDEITLNFDIIPEGSTITNAKASATLPKKGTGFAASSFPVIPIGQFADALNTTGSSTQPWIYMGGGSLVGPVDGHWTMRLPLHRFVNITSATVIS